MPTKRSDATTMRSLAGLGMKPSKEKKPLSYDLILGVLLSALSIEANVGCSKAPESAAPAPEARGVPAASANAAATIAPTVVAIPPTTPAVDEPSPLAAASGATAAPVDAGKELPMRRPAATAATAATAASPPPKGPAASCGATGCTPEMKKKGK